MLTERRSGILLHPTSLPGRQPVGSLGKEAYNFIDSLVRAGQSIWQILPLGPTGYGNCPYSCFSAFAGNPLLIDLHQLTETGELQEPDLPTPPESDDFACFEAAHETVMPLLIKACDHFRNQPAPQRLEDFDRFCETQAEWLEDYALFQVLRELNDNLAWQQWPETFRHRHDDTLNQIRLTHSDQIFRQKFIQFLFFDQWHKLKSYANDRGISILGDLPIFVAADSADVWALQHLFHLDDHGHPSIVAGVPPDYFSPTGQRWGNPLYRWECIRDKGFSWWLSRFDWNLELFDLVRVDHFRGFSACWAIPSAHQTAEQGYWMEAPGPELFARLTQTRKKLPLIAEDLGIITADVTALRDQFRFPGMKILQFAFDSGSDNPYLPHNHRPNSVVYTGTHDNNTSLGWWQSLDDEQRQRIKDYLRRPCHEMPWPLIETAFASVSLLAICPMQDILSLPESSRMNIPGTTSDNWRWRMRKSDFNDKIIQRLKNLSHLYGRNLCIPTEMRV